MTSSHGTLVAFLVFWVFLANTASQTHGFSISLISIDQLDKSLFPENLTLRERYQRIAEISRARVHQLERATSLSSAKRQPTAEYEPYTLQPRITFNDSSYFVTSLTVGSRSYAPYLVVDTGSDDTWMQCEGCTECFHIRQGNFHRLESKSYRALPCNDTRCFPRICIDRFCMYKRDYFGFGCFDCYSKGAVGLDTFGFRDRSGAVKSFPKTTFGCGLENHKVGWGRNGENNIIAGILGLGIGPRSILFQYKNETKMRMSYCLPPQGSPTSTYAVLSFGDEAQIRGRVWTIRLLPNTIGYEVNLMGISVARTRLRLDPAIFPMKQNRVGRLLLDTGSLQTGLVRTAYNAVRVEIIQFFLRKYHWRPSPPQPRKFDLCYNVPSGNYTYPRMTFHFEGADLNLDVCNVFQIFDRGFCLIMMPIDGPTSILGTFQQANFRFLFDLRAFTVSFVREVCN